ALLKALADLGLTKVESRHEPVALNNYYGRPDQLAHVVIRKQDLPGASADVGFRQGADGKFELVLDSFGRGQSHLEGWLDQVSQRYAYHVSIDTLTAQGFELSESVTEADGTIRLTLNNYSLG